MQSKEEIWKEIDGYNGHYLINAIGQIKSKQKNWKNYRIKTPVLHPQGYYTVVLWLNYKPKLFKIHRLIAQYFIPNPLNLPAINHKNGIKTDNRIGNLEWCTFQHNVRHMFDNKLTTAIGETHYNSKLKKRDIKWIRENYHPKKMHTGIISKKFGITPQCAGRILLRKSWKHI